jgi:DNA ligase-1
MSAFTAMAEIESFTGKGSKKLKSDRMKKLTEHERKVFCLAYDPWKVYYLIVDPEKVSHQSPLNNGDELVELELMEICNKLATRSVVGHEAEALVYGFLSHLNTEQRMWAERIINKDLCIGASEETFLKVWPNSYKLFKCMLAEPLDGQDDILYGWAIEPKFDGLRAIGVPDKDGSYNCFSRNGKLLFGLDHICADMSRISKQTGTRWIFDGEACGEKWKDYAKARTKSATVTDLNYFCFDMLTEEEWNTQTSQIYGIRRKRKDDILEGIQSSIINVLSWTATPEYTAKQAMMEQVKLGLEGVVVKDQGAPYVWKRSGSWIKMKPRDNVDLEIVGANEGEPGKQYEGQLGALVVDFKGVHTEIGTGFSNEERKEFWALHKKGQLVGKTAEIEKGPVTDDGKLFHASFVRIRFDK